MFAIMHARYQLQIRDDLVCDDGWNEARTQGIQNLPPFGRFAGKSEVLAR